MSGLAVGLAYAQRLGDETIHCLVDLAGGRIAVLEDARQRIQTLEGLDAHVIDRATGLLDAAIRSPHTSIGAEVEAPAGT